MLKDDELFEDVRKCTSAASFWWLGQHSFILKLGELTILIDPFLSPVEGRQVPPLFTPANAKLANLVCCTHDHIDHLDPVAIEGLAQETRCTFIAPAAHKQRMLSLSVPEARLVLLNDRESVTQGEVTITAIKAAHERFDQTPNGHFPYLGYVFKFDEKIVYHAGDTVWWEGLQSQLGEFAVRVAMIPINGRDAVRYKQEIAGNMTYQEAADLIGGLDVELHVPTHYDMFEFNAENPILYRDYVAVKYPSARVWIGKPTTRVEF